MSNAGGRWAFRCVDEPQTNEWVLENHAGSRAGRVKNEKTDTGFKYTVINTNEKIVLILETGKGMHQRVNLFVPCRAGLVSCRGYAIYGHVDCDVSGHGDSYEYKNAGGLDPMRVSIEGFPRRLVIKNKKRVIAEITRKRGCITTFVNQEISDEDVLAIIGITIATALLMPMRAGTRRDGDGMHGLTVQTMIK